MAVAGEVPKVHQIGQSVRGSKARTKYSRPDIWGRDWKRRKWIWDLKSETQMWKSGEKKSLLERGRTYVIDVEGFEKNPYDEM